MLKGYVRAMINLMEWIVIPYEMAN
jgi:hypothetical protein